MTSFRKEDVLASVRKVKTFDPYICHSSTCFHLHVLLLNNLVRGCAVHGTAIRKTNHVNLQNFNPVFAILKLHFMQTNLTIYLFVKDIVEVTSVSKMH